MACIDQKVTDRYAAYLGDAIEVMPTLPDGSIHLSIYSPPFGGLYNYSSSPNDLSNCRTYEEFFQHYEHVVREIHRVTMPGRMSAVHAMDVSSATLNVQAGGSHGGLLDFPGDIIRLHQRLGFSFFARFAIWKEPLRVAIRTRSKGLTHKQLIKDSTFSNNAAMDQLLIFRKVGENRIPVAHPEGLMNYIGEREPPPGYVKKYTGWKEHKTNKLSQWIWQQYASSFWDDIRNGRVLPYKAARDKDDEKHVHPLQLDVIERCAIMWSNTGETVLSPFMGVGSEVYGALVNGRRGVGVELKPSYFRQALKNLDTATSGALDKGQALLELDEEPPGDWSDVEEDSHAL